ncbi:hypothetical protein BC826DRAFT_1009260 [Russula brevipes]|nr:hypothetical protein BC826DRAFT_1009260 [Russula brevipes]
MLIYAAALADPPSPSGGLARAASTISTKVRPTSDACMEAEDDAGAQAHGDRVKPQRRLRDSVANLLARGQGIQAPWARSGTGCAPSEGGTVAAPSESAGVDGDAREVERARGQ